MSATHCKPQQQTLSIRVPISSNDLNQGCERRYHAAKNGTLLRCRVSGPVQEQVSGCEIRGKRCLVMMIVGTATFREICFN